MPLQINTSPYKKVLSNPVASPQVIAQSSWTTLRGDDSRRDDSSMSPFSPFSPYSPSAGTSRVTLSQHNHFNNSYRMPQTRHYLSSPMKAVHRRTIIEQLSEPPQQTRSLAGASLIFAMIALNILMFLTALDTTIVASTYITIASEFQSMDHAQWIINSYLITTTATQPLYGKISDIIGRVQTIVAAVVLFLGGSIMCAMSTSLGMLIASRCVQGLGGGGLMTLVSVVLGDILSEHERGNWVGLFAATWGVTSAIAPVIGGAIVRSTTWRIIFWINVPICAIATAIILLLLRLPKPKGSLKDKLLRVDFLGSIISMSGIVLFLLALTWGGAEYSWGSLLVVSCLVSGIGMLGAFVMVEWRIPREPLMPLRLLKSRNIALSSFSFLFFGAAVYGPIMFIPQWAIIVKNASNIESGLYLLPMMVALIISATASGLVMSSTGRYREIIWLSGVLLVIGNSLLVMLDQNASLAKIIGPLFVTGLGFGCANQSLSIVEQANAAVKDMATATTLGLFLRSVGAIIVVAVLSSVMQNSLAPLLQEIMARFPEFVDELTAVAKDQSQLHSPSIPEEVRGLVIGAYMKAMRSSFIALIPFTAVYLLLTLGIQHKALEKFQKHSDEIEMK